VVQTSISARHGHLSATTQARITEKVEKLSRYFDRLTAVHVTVDLEHRESPLVELCVSVEHAEPLVAADQGANITAALDKALHKIEQQIRRHKDKRTERRKPPLKHLEVPAEVEPDVE
jgi:putative sigma-54 modulation protein